MCCRLVDVTWLFFRPIPVWYWCSTEISHPSSAAIELFVVFRRVRNKPEAEIGIRCRHSAKIASPFNKSTQNNFGPVISYRSRVFEDFVIIQILTDNGCGHQGHMADRKLRHHSNASWVIKQCMAHDAVE
jgi:hypothetical protein